LPDLVRRQVAAIDANIIEGARQINDPVVV
jgi:hypothetical protein